MKFFYIFMITLLVGCTNPVSEQKETLLFMETLEPEYIYTYEDDGTWKDFKMIYAFVSNRLFEEVVVSAIGEVASFTSEIISIDDVVFSYGNKEHEGYVYALEVMINDIETSFEYNYIEVLFDEVSYEFFFDQVVEVKYMNQNKQHDIPFTYFFEYKEGPQDSIFMHFRLYGPPQNYNIDSIHITSVHFPPRDWANRWQELFRTSMVSGGAISFPKTYSQRLSRTINFRINYKLPGDDTIGYAEFFSTHIYESHHIPEVLFVNSFLIGHQTEDLRQD